MKYMLNKYSSKRVMLGIFSDFGLLFLITVGVIISQIDQPWNRVLGVSAFGIILAISMLSTNLLAGLYHEIYNHSVTQSCARVFIALAAAMALTYIFANQMPFDVVNADSVILAAMIGVSGVIVRRGLVERTATQRVDRHKVLVFGSGTAAKLVGTALKSSCSDVELVGYLPGPNEEKPTVNKSELLSGMKSLTRTVTDLQVDEIVVALSERRGGSMPLRELLDCKLSGIKVVDAASRYEKTLGKISVDHTSASWFIFGGGFSQGVIRATFKRICDILVASVLIVLTLPLMLLAAILIMVDSRGPVIFRQERVGLNGRILKILKFRSMYVDTDMDSKPSWTVEEDQRITKVGKIMRRTRIDELPQLFNVLRGEMSLVGPRPEQPFFVESLTRDIPYYAVRHSVKPGVTGWAQVRFQYGSTIEDTIEKLQYDLYYVKNNNLFLDICILIETIVVVTTARGSR